MHVRSPVVTTVMAISLVGVLCLPGCAKGTRASEAVRPVNATVGAGSAEHPDAPREPPTGPSEGPTSTVVEPGDNNGTGSARGHAAESRGSTAAIDGALDAYDTALTALSAGAEAATDEDHPLVQAWHEIVQSGTQLDRQVRTRITTNLRSNQMRIEPDASGFSYRHRSLSVSATGERSLSFTYCGYSPGIGRDVATGDVVDDRRASTTGHGSGRLDVSGRLRIEELTDDSIRMLTPDTPDPCEAAARAVR